MTENSLNHFSLIVSLVAMSLSLIALGLAITNRNR